MNIRNTFEPKSKILDFILTQYKKITDAPRSIDDEFKNQERQKKYKAINPQTGNVFLIMNPAARNVWRDAQGRIWYENPKVEMVMSWEAAVIEARSKTIFGTSDARIEI